MVGSGVMISARAGGDALFPSAKTPVERIPPGKDAGEAVIVPGHQNAANGALAHASASPFTVVLGGSITRSWLLTMSDTFA